MPRYSFHSFSFLVSYIYRMSEAVVNISPLLHVSALCKHIGHLLALFRILPSELRLLISQKLEKM